MISIVIPVFNEGNCIEKNIETIMKNIPCENEIIIVDDGSKDNTWDLIKKLSIKFNNVKGLRFSRNFGKEIALMAGLNNAMGDAVITMDSDLQHPPEYIETLIEKWKQGFQIVHVKKAKRNKESFLYKICAKSFYCLLKRFSSLDMKNSSDYKLLDKKVVNAINNFKEKYLFYRGIVEWTGFEVCTIELNFNERKDGKSKFKFKSLLKLALNAITSFSFSLLYIPAVLSCCLSIIALIYVVMFKEFAIFTQLIIGSQIMFCLAIIGIYVGKIFEEVKNRPQYIISEKTY